MTVRSQLTATSPTLNEYSPYIDRFINDGVGWMSCTAGSPLRIVFRVERGLLGPVTGVFRGFGIRGQVAVGRISLAIVRARLPSDVMIPGRADAENGALSGGAFQRGLQNE